MSDDNPPEVSKSSPTISEAVGAKTELFREQQIKPVVIFTVGVYGLLGFSLGATSYAVLWAMLDGGGLVDTAMGYLIALVILLSMLFLGSFAAAFVTLHGVGTGLVGSERLLEERSMIFAGSCYAGMIVMTTVASILIRAALPAVVAVEFGFGRVLILSLVVAIPAAIVAVGIVWLDDRYLSEDADRMGVIEGA